MLAIHKPRFDDVLVWGMNPETCRTVSLSQPAATDWKNQPSNKTVAYAMPKLLLSSS